MKITISKEDEKEFYNLLGADTYKLLPYIIGKLHKKNPTMQSDCAKVGSYSFIPMEFPHIMKELITIRKWIKKQNKYYIKATEHNKKSSFLDAGSGLGNILIAAKAAKLAKRFTGIEFNKPTHERAKKFINNKDKDFSLLLDDILTYSNYSMFDIIYYYGPLKVGVLELHFEELVEDEASVGTIILPKMKTGRQIDRDKRFKKVRLFIRYHKYDYDIYTEFYIKVKDSKREKSSIPAMLKSRGLPPGKIDKNKLNLIKNLVAEGKLF